MLSAFTSVFFACKQQRVIGRLLWEERKSIELWMIRESEQGFPILRLSVVFLFSTTRIFLDIALLTYIIGLGVYLGCVWQSSLDVDAGQSDIHNIFISFCSYTGFCIFLYFLMSFSNHYKREEWGTYSKCYRERKRPESSCPNAIKETKNHGQALHGVELKGKQNSRELSGLGRTDEHILECSSCGKEKFLNTTEEVGTV
jgi:hypothetical protein